MNERHSTSRSQLQEDNSSISLGFSLLANHRFGIQQPSQRQVLILQQLFPRIVQIKITDSSLIFIFNSLDDIPDKRLQLGDVPTFYTTDPDHLGMEHDLGMIAFGHPILNDLLLPYATVAPLKCYYIITQVLTDMGIRLFGIGLIFGGSLSIAVSKDQLNANLPKEIAGRLVYWRSNIPDRSQTFGVKLRTPADLWLH